MDACCCTEDGQEVAEAATAEPQPTRRWRELAARGLLVGLLLGAVALWIAMVL